MRRVTVLIPTFNRSNIITKAIHAHLAQSAVDEMKEILVIDDGSTDMTEARVSDLALKSPVPIRYWRQSNRGQAAARNVGIREASGEIILFADDDIVPAPTLLLEHLRWHDRHPEPSVAVLGFVEWSREVRPTPFMKWFGLDGPLFAYGHIVGRAELDFRYFYSCNLSIKTEFLRRAGIFDENFTGYGYEDCELGYRLQRNGMRLLYNPDAVGYHYKHVTFAGACRRAEQLVVAFRLFQQSEAGRRCLELVAEEQADSPKPGPMRSLLAPFLRRFKRLVLGPAKFLVDSQIPLPWGLYRRLYAEAASKAGLT